MTREQFDSLYYDKVVHCDTEEKANEFLTLAHSVGHKWFSGSSPIEENLWEHYKEKTCYELTRSGLFYARFEFFKNGNHKIIEYQLQPKFKVGDKVRVNNTQSFYIDGKIGVIEKVDMLSGLPYFVNIYGDGWLWVMAEENLEKFEEPTETIDDIIGEIKKHQKSINVLLNRLKEKENE